MPQQQIGQIMTKNVVSVSSEQSVAEAAQKMSQYNIGSVPVVENGQVVGILTDRDVSLRATSKGLDPNNTKVNAIMSQNLVTGSSQMDVHEAADLMKQKQIRRLPVVDNNQLAGMVSIGDLATKNIYQNEAGEALSGISQPSSPLM